MNAQLRQIANLIKSRQLDEARQQLDRYLEQRSDDAWAWYLRSFVESNPDAKVVAARRALSLAPHHEQIQTRLVKLLAVRSRKPAPRWPLFVAASVALLVVIAVSALALRGGTPSPDTPLPTLAALDSPAISALPTATTVEIVARPEDQTAESTFTVVPSPAEATLTPEAIGVAATPGDGAISVETTAIVPGDTPVSLPSSDPGQSNGAATTAIPGQDTTAPVIESTPTPNQPSSGSTPTVFSRPTRTGLITPTPAASPTPVPDSPTPAFGVISDNGVPMNIGLNIGTGEMRIVSAVRPAEARIAELGGSAPNVPADQSWVLVEALLVCSGESNCTPNPAGLWVVSASGAAYAHSGQLNLPPVFGSTLSNQQVWGYLGFIVPENESNLRLVLAQGGQTYVFSLQ